jgi:SAM-dependent methyltransferase
LGIEARRNLVAAAREHLSNRPFSSSVEFRVGDILSELSRLNEGFDTVFCFGFLYHTIDHMALLRAIRRLNPKHLIIDTAISSQPGAIIEVWEEAIDREAAAAFAEFGSPGWALKGWPTKSALEIIIGMETPDESARFRDECPVQFQRSYVRALEPWLGKIAPALPEAATPDAAASGQACDE